MNGAGLIVSGAKAHKIAIKMMKFINKCRNPPTQVTHLVNTQQKSDLSCKEDKIGIKMMKFIDKCRNPLTQINQYKNVQQNVDLKGDQHLHPRVKKTNLRIQRFSELRF